MDIQIKYPVRFNEWAILFHYSSNNIMFLFNTSSPSFQAFNTINHSSSGKQRASEIRSAAHVFKPPVRLVYTASQRSLQQQAKLQ